jgi:uncharacterized alkaline shock family protein YloU
MPGRSLVTRRAVRDLVRNAALSVYGVTGLAGGGPVTPVLEWLGVPHPGLRLAMDGTLIVELHLTVAYGLPVAEVARQVEVSVRYALRHALDREPDRVVIRVDGLRSDIGGSPPHGPHASSGVTGQLADSGTDVA